ncbi:MAG: hypothetical protein QG579_485 [Patescibacteria group bacterium]|jgi:uncharacterized membrane protein|nr:hypothetical protein [Patescibacteria group bacterium]
MEKISWNTIEYLHTEKTTDWYWIVGIITLSIALISIILNNIIFAILIVVSSFTLSLFASRKPEIINIEMNNSAVLVSKERHAYKDIESFWVETRDFNPRVLLKSKKMFMPFIVILIDDIEPEEVQTFLSKHLPEEEHSEPLLEKLLLYFGF